MDRKAERKEGESVAFSDGVVNQFPPPLRILIRRGIILSYVWLLLHFIQMKLHTVLHNRRHIVRPFLAAEISCGFLKDDI